MKKKAGFIVLAALLLLCPVAGGCKKEKQTPGVPVQEAWTIYNTEEIRAYTLDKDGSMYTFENKTLERGSEFSLNKYDEEGNRLFSRPFEDELDSYVETVAVKDGILYFAPCIPDGNRMCVVLHSYNLETEELIRLKSFPAIQKAQRILAAEDRIYLLGTDSTEIGGKRSDVYTYTGERVMYYVLQDGRTGELGIPEPIDIGLDEAGHLLLYTHTGKDFTFSLYDVAQDAIKTIAKTDRYKMCRVALCGGGEDILYQSNERGLVMSSLSALEVESELYPDGYYRDSGLCCVDGRAACMTKGGKIVQFRVDEVRKETPVIRYMTLGYELAAPYGCGYEMRQTNFNETEADKFALKIMALDKDFDLCLVNTAYSFSYNLKKNAMFYPLNDVPGVQEYLDSCFPYVREAATNEDGAVWMIPVAVNLPGLVVSEEELGKGRDLVKDDMTYEEYFSALASMKPAERRRTSTPWFLLLSEFFWQYFAENTSVDTAQFRDTLSLFAKYWKYLTEDKDSFSTKIYEHVRYEDSYHALYVTMLGENARVYDVPKVNPDGKNAGTCLFLAVNPHSDNLEAALSFISAWCTYRMHREDTPLFFADRATGDSIYEASLYKLYQNGTIGFTMDADVLKGYEDVLEDVTKLEDYIAETERKLRIYFGE